jgi:hypothetical protein
MDIAATAMNSSLLHHHKTSPNHANAPGQQALIALSVLFIKKSSPVQIYLFQRVGQDDGL